VVIEEGDAGGEGCFAHVAVGFLGVGERRREEGGSNFLDADGRRVVVERESVVLAADRGLVGDLTRH
jgi:hypothetical protein